MNSQMTRRAFAHSLTASIAGASWLANVATANACTAWQPSSMAPVFYGYRDYAAPNGTSPDRINCRVFYPSTGGTPADAPFLRGCRPYPLVLFVHGQCFEPEHYKKWSTVAAQLARSGYIVAVPQWPANYPWEADWLMLARLRAWMFQPPQPSDTRVWAGRIDYRTALVGHSYGALLGARLFSLSAYVSIDGPWDDWPSTPPSPLFSLTPPKLFLYGERGAGVLPGLWRRIPSNKYGIEFVGAEHWDYLRAGVSSCERDQGRGPCALVERYTIQSIVWFMAKHMPPQTWDHLRRDIPHDLRPPLPRLTTAQQFYAGQHAATTQVDLSGNTACRINMKWTLATGETAERTF